MHGERFALTAVGGMLLWLVGGQSPTAPPPSPPAAERTTLSCAGAKPEWLLCDDFEDGSFQKHWDIGGHQGRFPLEDFVRCGPPNFGYRDPCAAWSNDISFDHEWGYYGYDARQKFAPQPEFYVRWYQFVSEGFDWGTLEDKSVMLHDHDNQLVAYVGTNRNQQPSEPDSGPGMPFVANYQDIDTPETNNRFTRVNRFQNEKKLTLKTGRWYLFEWYLKMNTPGASDGETRLWIDDATGDVTKQTLRMKYTNMRWLREKDSARLFGEVRMTLYHQRCDIGPNRCPPLGPDVLTQSHRWDRLVVSTAPIGPVK